MKKQILSILFFTSFFFLAQQNVTRENLTRRASDVDMLRLEMKVEKQLQEQNEKIVKMEEKLTWGAWKWIRVVFDWIFYVVLWGLVIVAATKVDELSKSGGRP